MANDGQTKATEKDDDQHEGHSAMAMRGVTRPQMHDDSGEDDEMKMSHEDRIEMRQKHHDQTLWVPLTIIMLGLWLLSAPFTFGYAS